MELKRVYINYGERDLNNCFLIFGSAKDIEKEYEQLERDGYTPFYNESPKFNYDKNYGHHNNYEQRRNRNGGELI